MVFNNNLKWRQLRRFPCTWFELRAHCCGQYAAKSIDLDVRERQRKWCKCSKCEHVTLFSGLRERKCILDKHNENNNSNSNRTESIC